MSSLNAQLMKNVTSSSVWTFCPFAQPPSLQAVNTRDPSNLASKGHSCFSDRNWKLKSVVESRDWFLTSPVTTQRETQTAVCLLPVTDLFEVKNKGMECSCVVQAPVNIILCPVLFGAVGWVTALQAGRSRVRFPIVSLEYFIDIILPTSLWPRVDSASNRNEYQECFLMGKGDRYVGLTLPPSCADCLKIWKPQTPGTLRPCPGL